MKKCESLEIICSWHSQYGNTFRTSLGRTVVITIEPKNVQAVLALKFQDFDLGYRNNAFSPLLRQGFFLQVADVGVYKRHVSNLIASIPQNGTTVDLQELFFQMTMDSATEFLFRESINSLRASNEQPSFAKDLNTSQNGLTIRNGVFSKATLEIRRFVDRFAQKALEYRDAHVDDKHTTTAPEQRYVFLYELSKQTADKTLRKEVLEVENERPSFEELKSMTYLTWVLNETLRLYPAVPVNIRTANKDAYLPVGGGPDGKDPIFVPKGQDVMYSVYSMHRLPAVSGPDATEYRLERWASLKPGWTYIPFNGGPRICTSQQFALIEASYTILRLIQRFKSIESQDAQPFKEALTLTLASEIGTKVSLTLP
ncbi:n-alkane-inducible cytochrome P450 [Dactylonectria estremocensis]|uniref:N-alkane-inducible cytochrome P450 n=1 Tax=Dactylonectria estremocensis TaxID=1079267 RepID=A0A9P9J4L5_9HYPO|nr:n-alkane-inducible cytochrome P450 [Dactylonectria estremocensis]